MTLLAGQLQDLSATSDAFLFGRLLKQVHEIVVAAAQNEYLMQTMAPLQGLSRRFWFANILDQKNELTTAATLHSATLKAMVAGDEASASSASLALNDYLTDFAYRTLKRH